ncbi:MAG: sugar transferase, partial [Methylococcales bacterium]|nr:sugar transferase [Methylococcales bacterium]
MSNAYLGLFAAELVVLFAAMYLGSELRFLYAQSWYSDEYIILSSLIFSIVTTISNVGLGLYRRSLSWDDYHLLQRIGVSFFSSMIVLLVIYYSFPEFKIARSVLLSTFVIAFLGMLFCRYLFYKYINHSDLKKKILVIGAGKNANILVNSNDKYIHRGFNITACLAINEDNVVVTSHKVILKYESILSVVKELDIDEIVLAFDDRRCTFPMDDLLDCKVYGIDVVDLLTFYEREKSIIDLENIYPSWFVFSDGFASGGLRIFGKRIVDILASFLLFMVSWP